MITTRLRTRLRFPLAAVLAVAAAALPGAQTFDGQRDPQPAEVDLAIVGGLLIDGHEGPPLPGAIVLVEGNRIVAVGSRDELTVPDGVEVVDARGMTILPGRLREPGTKAPLHSGGWAGAALVSGATRGFTAGS